MSDQPKKEYTLTVKVTAPADVDEDTVLALFDRITTNGMDAAMDTLQMHRDGDIDDPDIEAVEHLEIGPAVISVSP